MSFCQADERYISDTNYLFFEGVKPLDDEGLLEALAPFLNEINFCGYYDRGVIADLKEVNGAQTDKGDEVRKTLTAIQKKARLSKGLLVMSFGELYLSYGSIILQKLGLTLSGLRTGSVRVVEGAYPVEYLVLYPTT
jgi:hypothetical protein